MSAYLRDDHARSNSYDEKFDAEKHIGRSLSSVSFLESESHICLSAAGEVAVAEFEDPNLEAAAHTLEDDSPYPEVRSAVSNTDDPDMPCSTLRAWVIGLVWAILIPGLNQFFFFRYPAVSVGGLVAQLLSFPVGRAWAQFMPKVKIFGISVNPGPFTVKEHVRIYYAI
jgi:hypothetical protein